MKRLSIPTPLWVSLLLLVAVLSTTTFDHAQINNGPVSIVLAQEAPVTEPPVEECRNQPPVRFVHEHTMLDWKRVLQPEEQDFKAWEVQNCTNERLVDRELAVLYGETTQGPEIERAGAAIVSTDPVPDLNPGEKALVYVHLKGSSKLVGDHKLFFLIVRKGEKPQILWVFYCDKQCKETHPDE